MTNQIETLMALADDYADWAEAKGKGHLTYAESRQALQSALEAALKPGEPVAWMTEDDSNGVQVWLFKKTALRYSSNPEPLYAAPLAQTKRLDSDGSRLTPPPRLTDAFIEEAHWGEMCNRDLSFARAIETAVRKQFGYE